jgi:hypothetical protein
VTAKSICAVRDEFRRAGPELPRLIFCDIMIPHQSPASQAGGAALRMVEAGVDAVGTHLQSDARRATPKRIEDAYLGDVVRAVFERIGKAAPVQVVGGLSIAQAKRLARVGLRAFVISGNMGLPDSNARYNLPPAEIQRLVAGSSPRCRAPDRLPAKKTGFPRVRKAGVKPNPSSHGGPVRSLRIRTGSEAVAVCCAVPERWLPRRSRSCAASAGSGSGCHRC